MSQRGLLKLLKPKTSEIVREQDEDVLESEPRQFCTPTISVKISSTLNDDTNISHNSINEEDEASLGNERRSF